MSMVPIRDSVCRGCGRSMPSSLGYRCSTCLTKPDWGNSTAPAPREKIRQCSFCKVLKPLSDMMLWEDGWLCPKCYPLRAPLTTTAWCSTCKVRKPLSEMSPQKRGWICLDCNPRGVLGAQCPICNVIKASSEMATDRKCCLECAVELDRGVGLTECPECGKQVAAARDGAALCTECATRPTKINRAMKLFRCDVCGNKMLPPKINRDGKIICFTCASTRSTPGAVEDGRICLICRLPRRPEMFPGQGTICKTCQSSLPRELVERMQRCRGCNLKKPASELLGTMYCAECRQLQELQAAMKAMPGIEVPGPIAGAYTPTDKRSAAVPQIGRIPRAIATEEE